MGGAVGIAVSLVTIWIWWPYGGFFLVAAIVLGIVDWWSFGVMHNAALRGRRFWDISIRSAVAAPDFATSVNMVASVAQTGLLIWGIIQSDAITWWQALVAVAGLSVLLMFIPTLIVFLPVVALVLVLIRACG